MLKRQLLLAHRGYSDIAPENTQLAFELAFQYRFDGVELDVHLTKDGELVIIHDETTTRTALVDKTIELETLASLKQDDHSAFFKFKTQPQPIMTLKEFFDQYLDKFQLINVEIKTDQKEYPGIEAKIDALAQQYGKKVIEKVVFSSFNFASLQRLYDINPNYQIAFLFWTKKQFQAVDALKIKQVCQYLHPWTNIYEKFPDMVLSLQLPLGLWTLNSEVKFHQFRKDRMVYAQIANKKFEV